MEKVILSAEQANELIAFIKDLRFSISEQDKANHAIALVNMIMKSIVKEPKQELKEAPKE